MSVEKGRAPQTHSQCTQNFQNSNNIICSSIFTILIFCINTCLAVDCALSDSIIIDVYAWHCCDCWPITNHLAVVSHSVLCSATSNVRCSRSLELASHKLGTIIIPVSKGLPYHQTLTQVLVIESSFNIHE